MAKKKEECPECEEIPIWLVTNADMTNLLLTFFILLVTATKGVPQQIQLILSAFSDNLGFFEGGQTLEKGRLQDMGMNMESLPSQAVGRSLLRAKAKALSVLKKEVTAKKVRIEESERGLVISLIGAEYFEPGSAMLTPYIEEVLRKVGSLLLDLNRYVRIEGHANNRENEISSPYPNERNYLNSWDLGSARALQVIQFLQDIGVEPSLMQLVSYGAYRKIVEDGDQGTPESKAHNRRIDIVILPYKEPIQNPFDKQINNLPSSIENLLPEE